MCFHWVVFNIEQRACEKIKNNRQLLTDSSKRENVSKGFVRLPSDTFSRGGLLLRIWIRGNASIIQLSRSSMA